MTDELKDIIYADLFRYTGNTRRYKNIYACYLEERMSSPEFSYISTMRRTRFYYDQIPKYDGFRKKLYEIKFRFTNFRLDRLSRKYHFQIPYDTEIGKGFYLAHFGRVIIHPKSVIGHNVNVSTGVVIGTQFRGKRKGSPHIGNYVWIGANAIIVGNINIGYMINTVIALDLFDLHVKRIILILTGANIRIIGGRWCRGEIQREAVRYREHDHEN